MWQLNSSCEHEGILIMKNEKNKSQNHGVFPPSKFNILFSNSPKFIKPLVMAIHVHKYPKSDKTMKRREP